MTIKPTQRIIEIKDQYQDKQCSICLDGFTGDLPVTHDDANGRKHVFHRACLRTIQANPIPCPVCRATMDPEDRILQPAIFAAKRKEALVFATDTAAFTAVTYLGLFFLGWAGTRCSLSVGETAAMFSLGSLCIAMGSRLVRKIIDRREENVAFLFLLTAGAVAFRTGLFSTSPQPSQIPVAHMIGTALASGAVIGALAGLHSLFSNRAF